MKALTAPSQMRRRLILLWVMAILVSVVSGPLASNGLAFGEGEPIPPQEEIADDPAAEPVGEEPPATEGATESDASASTESDASASDTSATESDASASTEFDASASAPAAEDPRVVTEEELVAAEETAPPAEETAPPAEETAPPAEETAPLAEEAPAATATPDPAPATRAKEDKYAEYTFTFSDGTVVAGSNRAGASGATDKDNEANLNPALAAADANWTLSKTVHVSCSDKFPGGWGEKGSPVQGTDPFAIVSYSISKFDKGELKETCGDSLPPPPPPPSNAKIDLEKNVSVDGGNAWFDADDPTGPQATVGANNVFFRFTVTNTGDVTLTNIDLTDTDFAIPADQVPASLDPGADFTIVLGPFVAQAGQHYNKATVTATDPAGGGGGANFNHPFDNKKHQYTFVMADGQVFQGSSDDKDATVPGFSDTIHLSCSDKFPGGWGEKGSPVQGVDPGPIVTYLISEWKDGKFKKSCGPGGPADTPLMDMDPAHYFGEPIVTNPAIDLEKNVSVDGGNTYFDADDPTGPQATVGANNVFFRFTVTNTGDVTLTNIDLTDTDFAIPADQVPASLDPGADFTIVLGPFVAQAGQHYNKATVTATDPAGGGGNGTFPQPPGPGKKAFSFFFENGQVVDGYTDGGDVDLSLFNPAVQLQTKVHLSCSDSFGFDTVKKPNNPNEDGFSDNSGRSPSKSLDGAEWRLRGFFITHYDNPLIPGKTPNLKQTCGGGDLGGPLMDMDPAHYFGQVDPPAIDIEKLVKVEEGDWFDADDPTGPSAVPGVDDIFFRFVITNTGGQTLVDLDVFELANTNYTFTFPQNIIDANDPLAPGASFQFDLGPFPATEGQHFNEVKVTAFGEGVSGGNANFNHPFDNNKYQYTFVMEDGQVFQGSSNDKDATVPGFVDKIHLSCSDPFPGGWGKKGSPVQGQDPGPIDVYLITHWKDGKLDKTCGPGGPGPSPVMVMDQDPAHYIGVGVPDIDIVKVTQDGGNAQDGIGPVGPAGDGITIPAGNFVIWLYEVTNPGTIPLDNVAVTDIADPPPSPTPRPVWNGGPPFNIGDLNENSLLDPGEKWLYEAKGEASEEVCSYSNDATVNATGAGIPVSATDPSSYNVPCFTFRKVVNGLDANSSNATQADPMPIVNPGDKLIFTFEVTNDSGVDVAAADISIVDDIFGDIATAGDAVDPVTGPTGDGGAAGVLEPGETWVYTLEVLAPAPSAFGNAATPGRCKSTEDIDSTTVHLNTATVTVNDVDKKDDANVCVNDFTFRKVVNGLDANSSNATQADPMPIVNPGDDLTFTFELTSGGGDNVAAADISIVDDIFGDIATAGDAVDPVTGPTGDGGAAGVLEPGETWVYTLVVPAPAPSAFGNAATPGRCDPSSDPDSTTVHLNTATVTVIDVDKEDPANVCVNDFTFRKVVNDLDANSSNATQADPMPIVNPGDDLTFTFELTSGGGDNVAAADISIVDNIFGDIVLAGVPQGTVTGPAGDDGDGALEPGETWVYTLVVPAPAPSAFGDAATPGRCKSTEDIDSTTVHLNTATVTVIDVDKEDDANVCVNDFTFRKVVNGLDANSSNATQADPMPIVNPGDDLTFTFELTSGGGDNVAAADISIVDDIFGDIVIDGVPEPGIAGPTGDGGAAGVLEPGETWVYTLVVPAPAPSAFGNAATPGRCDPSSDPDSTTVHLNTATVTVIDVDKEDPANVCVNDFTFRKVVNDLDANSSNATQADPMPIVNPGDDLTFTFELTSGGGDNVAAADISIVDDIFGDIVLAGVPQGTVTGPAGDDGDGVLEPGETWVYTLVVPAPAPSAFGNAATPGRCDPSSDPDSTTVHLNTATVTVIDVDKEDPANVCVNDFTFRKVVNDLDANSSNATQADPMPIVNPGDDLTFTFELTSGGGDNVAAADISIVDNIFGDIVLAGVPQGTVTGPAGDDGDGALEPGETWVYTLVVPAPAPSAFGDAATPGRCKSTEDIDSTTVHLNTATVTVIDVDKEDDANVCVNDFTFRKVVNGLDANSSNATQADPMPIVNPGDDLTFTFELTSGGGDNVAAADISIVDDIFGDIVIDGVPEPGIAGPTGDGGAAGVLEPGETWVYTLVVPAPAPSAFGNAATPGRCDPSSDPDSTTVHLNTATVTVIDVDKEDPANVCVNDFTFRKVVNDLDANSSNATQADPMPIVNPGDDLTFTFELTSGGGDNVAAADISIVDDIFGDIVLAGVPQGTVTGPAGDDGDGVLEPGETWVYTLVVPAPAPSAFGNAATPGRCDPSSDPDSTTVHLNTATVTVIDVDKEDPANVCVNDFTFRKVVNDLDANSSNATQADPMPIVNPGDDLTFTFELTSGGGDNVAAADISIVDNIFGDIVLAGVPQGTVTGPAGDDGDGALEPGETWVYTLVVPAPAPSAFGDAATPGRCKSTEDIDSTTVHLNTATVTVIDVDKEDDANVCVNDFTFRKVVNGLDANSSNATQADPMPIVNPGDDLTFTFELTSGGGDNVAAADISIVDDIFGDIVIDGVPEPGIAGPTGDGGAAGVLEPGETWVYTLVVPAPAPSAFGNAATPGRCDPSSDPDSTTVHLNTATVTVIDVDKEDPANVCVNDFTFRKVVNDLDANSSNATQADPMPIVNPGDDLTFTFELTSGGGDNVAAADISIVDDIFGDIVLAGVPQGTVTGPAGDDGDGVLEPGETWVYTLVVPAPAPSAFGNAATPGRCDPSSDPDSTTVHLNTATVTVIDVDKEDPANVCVGGWEPNKLIVVGEETFDPANPDDIANIPVVNPGDDIAYLFTITNTGGVSYPAANVSGSDPSIGENFGGTPDDGDDGDDVFEPGETWSYGPYPFQAPAAFAPGWVWLDNATCATGDVVIPTGTENGAPGSTLQIAVVASDPADIGKDCVTTFTAFNQSSVHPGNDLIVRSDGTQVVAEDVERESGAVTVAVGTLTIGPEIVVDLRFGEDGRFSGGGTLTFGCLLFENTVSVTIDETKTDDAWVCESRPPTPDLQIEKEANPEAVVVGKDFEYEVTVSNIGTGVATNVVMLEALPARALPPQDAPFPTGPFDEFPAFTDYDSNAPLAGNGTGDGFWQVNNPEPSVVGIPVGCIDDANVDCVFVNDASERLTSNGVTFNEVSDIDEEDVDTDDVMCRYDEALHAVRCDGFDLNPGAEITFTLDLRMNIDAFDRVWNRAYTYSDETLSGLETNVTKASTGQPCQTNSNTDIPPFNPMAAVGPTLMGEGCNYVKKNADVFQAVDLGITKTDSKDPVAVGEQFNYILTVGNVGGTNAPSSVVTDPLPAQVAFVSATPSVGTCNHDGSATGGTLTCDLGPMLAGASATITVAVIAQPGTEGTTFTNVNACVEGDFTTPNPQQPGSNFVWTDNNPANDCDSEPTSVPPPLQPPLGKIGDYVWLDNNSNGLQDAGEPGIGGVTVTLFNGEGNPVATSITASDGLYPLFENLPADDYKVTVDVATAPGLTPTTPTSINVELRPTRVLAGTVFLDADFGFVQPAVTTTTAAPPPTVAAAAATTAAPAETLPRTGMDTQRLGALSVALLLAGGILVLSARRRQDET